MELIKKGDIVSRNSYNNDILFYVDKIQDDVRYGKVAVLKGVSIRILADSPVTDLLLFSKKKLDNDLKDVSRSESWLKKIRNNSYLKYGKILHLDGDKRYSEKTEKYYRNRNLNYVVKHVAEFRQPLVIRGLLNRYRPDIVVFTGHDSLIKKGGNYNDINNYRNSKHFVNAVYEARIWNPDVNGLVIFAGACQSFYEALINAGANFASSPGRILIDFVDPLIVAENISITSKEKLVFMSDLERKIRNGKAAINGIGASGKSL